MQPRSAPTARFRIADTALAVVVVLLARTPLRAQHPGPVSTVVSPAKASEFLTAQLAQPRVKRAYARKAGAVRAMFEAAGITEPGEVFFRVFKREKVLEVWARGRHGERFVLLKRYPVCKLSGGPGPKRRQGDGQVPEGFYTISAFNPRSHYLLSLRVSYPNAVDRARSGAADPGGDIYIHGGCATIGCLPVGNEWIQELYLIAVEARAAGQRRIPVHIFPTRLDDVGLRWLARTYGTHSVDYPFWKNLRVGYLAFERTHLLPRIDQVAGSYVIHPAAPAPLGTPVRGANAAGRRDFEAPARVLKRGGKAGSP